MNAKRKALADFNATLPKGYSVSYSVEWEEWRVNYPYRGRKTFAPAADFEDAKATMRDTLRRLGA